MMTRLPRLFTLTLLIAVHASQPIAAQGPERDWRTVETPGFRVHYPIEYEAWTLRIAGKLEDIRARLVREVSYQPTARVDVLVMDPVAQPNGFVLPLLGSPRMVLWASPPGSDSVIGQFRSWPELLAVHEDAHLVHLLRPSRNPLARLLERTMLPLGPIVRRAPRWAIEGYATLLEGQLTGSGRPHSDLRAAILRRWAQHGRLPPYERLASDAERWQGMSMAYLAGSAYLEWLVDRRGEDSLRHLWARLTARTIRRFDEAFSGVFGETPETLYGRFTAEMTERAMIIERTMASHVREGELWQRIEWSTGLPAVSPEGDRIAIVIRQRERPARLVVWSTAPDEERERKWQRHISQMLERDPEDVAPVRERPLGREPLFELPAIDGADPESPRWLPDGDSMLFVRFEADAGGFLRPDIFRWFPERKRVTRVTRHADLRLPDPAPDGQWAAAVHHRHGFSQLVRVDLPSGTVAALTAPSVDIVYDSPRVSPDGRRLLYLRHDEGRWSAVVRDLSTGTERVLDTPRAATLAHPAWSRDGAGVFLSIGGNGFIDIHAWNVAEPGPPAAITRTPGAALGAAPAPGDLLYFLSLEPHGLDLRRIRVDRAPPLPRAMMADTLAPVVPPPPADPPRPAAADLAPGRAYGLGRQEYMPIIGGLYAPGGRSIEAGISGGDVVGRTSYMAMLSLSRGRGAGEGAAMAAAWRGWPVTPRLHIFTIDERPSAQPIHAPGLETTLDARRTGLELGAEWARQWNRRLRVVAAAGGLVAELAPSGGESMLQRIASGELRARFAPSRGSWRWRYSGVLRLDRGQTGEGAWWRSAAHAEAGLTYHRSGVHLRIERRHVTGEPSLFDTVQVGGLEGSIVPGAIAAARVETPALPRGALIGNRYDRQRLDIRALVPLPIFLERHRIADAGGQSSQWLRVIGTELAFATGPIPLARLPAPTFRVGAARVLDPPFEGVTRLWVSLTWRP